jgi:hypothetical protein
MFTTVAFGLCAFVVEAAGQIEIGVARYPAVAVGIVATDNCRVRLVLPEGMSTPLLMTNGFFHTFRVEKISESAAVLWIDNNRSFSIPRTNSL